MCRASGTMAYRLIWKPLGSLTCDSVLLIVCAFFSGCGTVGISSISPVVLKLRSFSRLPGGGDTSCAQAVDARYSAVMERVALRAFFIDFLPCFLPRRALGLFTWIGAVALRVRHDRIEVGGIY